MGKCLYINAEELKAIRGTDRQQINLTSELSKERIELIMIEAKLSKMKTKK